MIFIVTQNYFQQFSIKIIINSFSKHYFSFFMLYFIVYFLKWILKLFGSVKSVENKLLVCFVLVCFVFTGFYSFVHLTCFDISRQNLTPSSFYFDIMIRFAPVCADSLSTVHRITKFFQRSLGWIHKIGFLWLIRE